MSNNLHNYDTLLNTAREKYREAHPEGRYPLAHPMDEAIKAVLQAAAEVLFDNIRPGTVLIRDRVPPIDVQEAINKVYQDLVPLLTAGNALIGYTESLHVGSVITEGYYERLCSHYTRNLRKALDQLLEAPIKAVESSIDKL